MAAKKPQVSIVGGRLLSCETTDEGLKITLDPHENVVEILVSKGRSNRLPRSPAVKFFCAKVGFVLNRTQIAAINTRVTDLERWKQIVDEWMLHGFSSVNVKGMLNVYENGWQRKGKKVDATDARRYQKLYNRGIPGGVR